MNCVFTILVFFLTIGNLQLQEVYNYPAKEIIVNENHFAGVLAQYKFHFNLDSYFVDYEKIYVTLDNEDFFAGYFNYVENKEAIACRRYFLFDKKYFCCYYFEEDYPCTVSLANKFFIYTECYFVEKNKLVNKTKIVNLFYYLYKDNKWATISYVVSKKTKKYDFEVPKIQITTTTTLDEMHLYSQQIMMLHEKASESKILKWNE